MSLASDEKLMIIRPITNPFFSIANKRTCKLAPNKLHKLVNSDRLVNLSVPHFQRVEPIVLRKKALVLILRKHSQETTHIHSQEEKIRPLLQQRYNHRKELSIRQIFE